MSQAAAAECSVVMVLEGPLQSWGTQGRFEYRDTDREPSKSGVLGLVGAALGMPREDTALLSQLARLEMGVRVDRPGTLVRDYHTVGGGTFRGKPHSIHNEKEAAVTRRFYLADACFVVALSGTDQELLERVASALQSPHWPLALGRRSCAPSRPVFLAGPIEGGTECALRSVPWQKRKGTKEARDLRCVREVKEGKPRADVPTSFARYERAFTTRFVRDEWIPLSDLPGETDAPEPATTQPAVQ